MTEPAPERFTPYQRRLFVFLTVATFFEGYDFFALAQVLPNLRADFGFGKDAAGLLVMAINVGTVIAYPLVRAADRWGRRSLLTVTIVGYTTTTFLSGLAPNLWVFAACQMLARIFLIAEYAVSMVVAAEEFPAGRRGLAIGSIAAFSSLGAIACAGLVPILVQTDYGWRTVYLVSIVPLIVLAVLRRGLRETERFEREGRPEPRSLFHVWRTPYRKRIVALGVVWFFAYIANTSSIVFFKDYAVTERGMSDADVGRVITVAALVSMPLVFLMARAVDVIGRRAGAVIVFVAGSIGTFATYSVSTAGAMTVALLFGIFASSAYHSVLNAFTAELFPTEIRSDAFAWSNNLLGRISLVFSPAIVGAVAHDIGWSAAIRPIAVFPLVTLALVLWLLPETKGRSLDETAALKASS